MKVSLKRNGDLVIRIKKDKLKNWRIITQLFLDAYVDPDALVNLTTEEKEMLTLDAKIAVAIAKFQKMRRKKIAHTLRK